MKRHILPQIILLTLLAASCQKEPVTPGNNIPSENADHLAYILNEGLWGANDGSTTLVDLDNGSVQNDHFALKNGRGLGDVAQDIQIYGSNLWIVVFGSSTVEVADAKDSKSIRQISFAGRSPRFIVFHEDKAYVSCYNKYIYKIDTASLSVVDSCLLSGMQPEGLCIAGDKLCVANGWEYDNSGSVVYDNTMSIVDLETFTEVKKIQVGLNPSKVMAIDDSHVILSYWGNYGSTPSGMQIVDLATGQTEDLGIETSGFDIYQGNIYSYSFSYATGATNFSKTNMATRSTSEILTNTGVNFKSVYGISVNPENGNIIVLDSRQFRTDGDAYCFTPTGTKLWQAEVGKGPSKVVFL